MEEKANRKIKACAEKFCEDGVRNAGFMESCPPSLDLIIYSKTTNAGGLGGGSDGEPDRGCDGETDRGSD